MSIEKALITQAGPKIAISKLREKFKTEVAKGCTPEISHHRIDLEPKFYPHWKLRDDINCRYQERCDEALFPKHDDFIKLQIWISPDQKFGWIQSELFLIDKPFNGRPLNWACSFSDFRACSKDCKTSTRVFCF